MTKRWLLVIFGFALAGTPPVVESSHGTLYFIAASSTAIVFAADSLVSYDNGAPPVTTDKLISLGNKGVCFIGGYSSIAGKVYLEETVKDWISKASSDKTGAVAEIIGKAAWFLPSENLSQR
jgi:hypothetical protein